MHTEVKRLKGSRVSREGCRGKEARKFWMKMQHMVHLIKTSILTMKSLQLQVKRKRKVALQKDYLYKPKDRMDQKKHLLLVLQ